jgi:hypothetical protein
VDRCAFRSLLQREKPKSHSKLFSEDSSGSPATLAAEIAGNPLRSALKCWAACLLKKQKVPLILAPYFAFSAQFPLKQQEILLKKRQKAQPATFSLSLRYFVAEAQKNRSSTRRSKYA